MLEYMAKHMIVIKDQSYNEILNFLDHAEIHGKDIKTVINPLEAANDKKTVSYESRVIKRMFLQIRD